MPGRFIPQGKATSPSYLHADGLGSVVAATDPRGVLAETYRYRAFGEGKRYGTVVMLT